MFRTSAGLGLGIALGSLVLAPNAALAAIVTNTATGDVAGAPGDLDDATFDLDVSTLALVKTAFLTDGTQLASGAAVPRGSLVRFMIYVDNATAADVDSINVQDDLSTNFTFMPGTLQVDSTIVSGATEAAIYAAVSGAPAVTDAVDGDVAGVAGTTVSAGDGAGNGMVTVPRNRVFALLFTARVD
jgi:uncharacterized repeat protein (TIGR01451 family)